MKKSQLLILLLSTILIINCGGGGTTYAPEVNVSPDANQNNPPELPDDNTQTPDDTTQETDNEDPLVIDKNLACESLINDPKVNWYESGLTSDQDIIACLANSLGKPIGFGENATGGYDANGASKLIVIKHNNQTTIEQQVLDAVSSDEYRWIVFDKEDFAENVDIAMYRLQCDNTSVKNALGGATEAECLDHKTWCDNNNISVSHCDSEFFNKRLNNASLPIRNIEIGSNTTIDGRMSKVTFRFNGFVIGKDSNGAAVTTANNIILSHLNFIGAGHTEDHELDPDMLRTTGESHDVWIHKNTFDLTGDSAFDVKVGAYNITMSFNRIYDVKRSSLHGSSDSRTINSQITTTMHHNAFITRNEQYFTFGNTARRVPLLRRGKSHIFNNVFIHYRKSIFSVRVGAYLQFTDNIIAINQNFQEKDSLDASLNELAEKMFEVKEGTLNPEHTAIWFTNDNCLLLDNTKRDLSYHAALSGSSAGSEGNLSLLYNDHSQAMLNTHYQAAGQNLMDYVLWAAGNSSIKPLNATNTTNFNSGDFAAMDCQ